jgi:hypothetical protein
LVLVVLYQLQLVVLELDYPMQVHELWVFIQVMVAINRKE